MRINPPLFIYKDAIGLLGKTGIRGDFSDSKFIF